LGIAAVVSASPLRAVATEIKVRATVSTTQARVGESITFVFAVEGAQDVPAPALRVGGLDARYLGPSTQVSIVNGTMSSSVQHRYSLFALQPGRFEVGPITIQYQGKDYSTPPLAVEFVAAAAPPGSTDSGRANGGPQGKTLFATLSLTKPRVYLHERVALDIDLYIGNVRAGDLQFPTLSADGLAVDNWPQPTQRQQVIDGQSYQVVHFHTLATPLRAGTVLIGPASLRLNVYERNRGNGRGGANDPFFDTFFQQARQVDVRAEPIELTVLPLPENGRPADFSGAVGRFQMQVDAAPTEVVAGDPITVQLVVTGEGNLSDAAAPRLADATGFRIYEPRAGQIEAGRRSFEQVVIPNDSGVTALPSFRFSFFDPQTEQYQVVESAPIALRVSQPQQAPHADVVVSGESPRRKVEEKLGRDIVFIKDEPGDLRDFRSLGSAIWMLLAWLPVPPAALLVMTWYDRRRRRLSGDERYARFARAGKLARQGIAAGRAAIRNGNQTEFYEVISTTIREFLSAKLDLPAGGVDADAVAKRGCGPDVVNDLRVLYAACETARFAPNAAHDDPTTILQLAERIVSQVERERRRGGPALPSALLWPLCLAPFLIPSAVSAAAQADEIAAQAAASPQTAFYQGNQLYREGDYAAAVRTYEELRHSGADSLSLHFNLGNAYFKQGDLGRAILSYQRALLRDPGDPDARSNLEYAQSLTGVEPCAVPLWQRAAFPLATRFARDRLGWVTILAYTALFLCVAIQKFMPNAPRWFGFIAGLLAIVMTVTGASWARQVYETQWQQGAVVVAEGETTARFEPADNGTAHFTLKQGSHVRVLDRRDGWLQVARCDGRRGWIPQQRAAEL